MKKTNTLLKRTLMVSFVSLLLFPGIGSVYAQMSVSGKSLLDKCGNRIILRGVNVMTLYWDGYGGETGDWSDAGKYTFQQVEQSGANAARIFWHHTHGSEGWTIPASAFEATIKNCTDQGMIAIPSLWEATGPEPVSKFNEIVDFWVRPEIVSIINNYKDKFILNIANEWNAESDDNIRTSYKNAIDRIRGAGIDVPLMIDGGRRWSQDEDAIYNNAAYLLDQDPQRDIIFSMHMYDPEDWIYEPKGTTARLKSIMDEMDNMGICFTWGEFSRIGHNDQLVAWEYLIDYAQTKQQGWLAWTWWCCSGDGDNQTIAQNKVYGNWFNDPWGETIANTISSQAVRVCTGGGDTEPPTVPTGLYATSITETGFILNWSASSDNIGVTGYEVFQDGSSIGTSSDTDKTVSGLSPGTTYIMKVRARDAAGNWSAQSAGLNVTTSSSGGSTTVSVKISSSNNDVEEVISGGTMNLTSNDLDIRSTDICAMRFALDVPQGATVESADIDFIAKSATSGSNTFTFRGQASDDASAFTTSTGNLSSRAQTSASVTWNPTDWSDGNTYTSPDLSSIIQEIVHRSGWVANNNMVILVTASSSNKRSARTFDYSGNDSNAPELTVRYSSSGGGSPVSNKYFEAEDGSIQTPMQIQSDAAASGGQFVTVAPGNNSTGSVPSTGKASYTVDLEAGTYKIWGRIIAPNYGDDSFWVQIDNGTAYKWNNIQSTSTWAWDEVHDADASNAVVTWNLSAGTHTINFYYREDGTKLDQVYITKNGDTPGSAARTASGPNQLEIKDQLMKDIDLIVYPNPATNAMYLDLKNMINAEVSVFDLSGRAVFQQASAKGRVTIELPQGVYLLRAKNSSKIYSTKIIFK